MSTLIQGLVGLFWTAAYVEIAYRGLRERTYGMPIVALWFNITWEFYWSVVERPPGQTSLMTTAQIIVDAVWLAVDAVILFSVLRYGPAEFRALPRWAFYLLFAVTGLLVVPIQVILTRDFDRLLIVPVVFGSNLLMSALFIAMLLSRRSRRGQSLSIGTNKLLGTALAAVGVSLYAPDRLFTDTPLLPVLYAGTLALDLGYLLLLATTGRPAATAARAGRSPRITAPEVHAT